MSLSDRDRALRAAQGRSALPRGHLFAWTYWQAITRLFPAVSWSEFRDWELWQVGAALGLDKLEPTDEEKELLARFNEAAMRPPSPDRKG